MTLVSPAKVNRPISRACLCCRNKHLRCDGKSPKCSRCLDVGTECVYVQSRRGIRKELTRVAETSVPALASHISNVTSVPDLSCSSATILSESGSQRTFGRLDHQSLSENAGYPSHSHHDKGQNEHLIIVYYQTIHPAHPFLLPYNFHQHERARYPKCLLGAMRYIASHHTSIDPETYRQQVNRVYDVEVPDSVFKVQTLLLLALACYARFERDAGAKALATALDVALKINLNSNDFGSDQNCVLRESWRRTWWELFIMNGLISLTSGSKHHLPLPENMTLPTHDHRYEKGDIDPVGTNATMQQRFLSEDTSSWSSFAYRVEAMRILNCVLNLPDIPASDDGVEAIEASITGFILSIPKDRAEGLNKSGEFDEVMSCGLMIIHLASICLHFERSDLGSVRGLATVCGNDYKKGVGKGKRRRHHIACLNSAKALANLLVTRTSLSTLSPCFSCAIAFAAMVQLAECRLFPLSQAGYVKEQLMMQLSVLKRLSETWPVANVVHQQLAQFSREVFSNLLDEPETNMSPSNVVQEPWMQELLNENFQTLLDSFFIQGTE